MKNYLFACLVFLGLAASVCAAPSKFIFSISEKCKFDQIESELRQALPGDDAEYLAALNMYIVSISRDEIDNAYRINENFGPSGQTLKDCILYFEEDQIMSIN
mmetsp:Transcript_30185/g.34288  ORF Transcript_30185/g.34288 Transcript_30185/m.34288 type:complete len:103 (-) Transcript_30185:229-537(-)